MGSDCCSSGGNKKKLVPNEEKRPLLSSSPSNRHLGDNDCCGESCNCLKDGKCACQGTLVETDSLYCIYRCPCAQERQKTEKVRAKRVKTAELRVLSYKFIMTVRKMTCNSCARKIRNAVYALGSDVGSDSPLYVNEVEVNLEEQTVSVSVNLPTNLQCGNTVDIASFDVLIGDQVEEWTQSTGSVLQNTIKNLDFKVTDLQSMKQFYYGNSKKALLLEPLNQGTPKRTTFEEAAVVDIKPTLTTYKFSVFGMTCASCVAQIEKSLRRIDGIEDVSVTLVTETCVVDANAALITQEQVRDAIDDMGYEVEIKENIGEDVTEEIVTIGIEGMTCASCVNSIETMVNKNPGVIFVSVNLLMEKAEIKYDPRMVGVRDLLEIIEDSGFGAELSKTNTSAEAHERRERKRLELKKWRVMLILSIIFTIPIVIIAMILPLFPTTNDFLNIKIYKSFTVSHVLLIPLTTVVQFYVGRRFFTGAWGAVKHGGANMDVLVIMGTMSAYIYSIVISIIALCKDNFMQMQYFDASAMIISFLLVGKYLEHLTKNRTSEAITALLDLQATSAVLVTFDAATESYIEKEIDIDLVQIGDILKVVPGTTVPTDGVITQGRSSVDESMISGESLPVVKDVGSKVVGGSMNTHGAFQFKATQIGAGTALSQITKLVENAQTSKPPIQGMADKIAGIFVPVIVVISLFVLVLWLVLGHTVVPVEWIPENSTPFSLAFIFMIDVLVIACPCSLGLATPTAVMVGTGLAAKHGVMIKSGAALEIAHKINTIVFDKTGTLTNGKPVVTDCFVNENGHMRLFDINSNDRVSENVANILQRLALAESSSEHPLGKAVFSFCTSKIDKSIDSSTVHGFEAQSGRGLRCKLVERNDKSITIAVGNRQWMKENRCHILPEINSRVEAMENQGKTVVFCSVLKNNIGELQAIVAIADTIRDEAVDVIRHLQNKKNIEVYMMTGDNRKTASAIAHEAGISKVFAEVLPSNKAEKVKELQEKGYVVAMIGDGINDSPALAQADVGVAIGAGTDVAIEAADFVLMRSDLKDVVTAFDISGKTYRRIIMNFAWAYGYNCVALIFAAGVLFPVTHKPMPPWVSAMAMAASSVSVVCSSLLLNWYSAPIIETDNWNTVVYNRSNLSDEKQHEPQRSQETRLLDNKKYQNVGNYASIN